MLEGTVGGRFLISGVVTSDRFTMGAVELCVLFILISSSVAEDIQLKYKKDSKPVRLFTDEDLRRHDGSEVSSRLSP